MRFIDMPIGTKFKHTIVGYVYEKINLTQGKCISVPIEKDAWFVGCIMSVEANEEWEIVNDEL